MEVEGARRARGVVFPVPAPTLPPDLEDALLDRRDVGVGLRLRVGWSGEEGREDLVVVASTVMYDGSGELGEK